MQRTNLILKLALENRPDNEKETNKERIESPNKSFISSSSNSNGCGSLYERLLKRLSSESEYCPPSSDASSETMSDMSEVIPKGNLIISNVDCVQEETPHLRVSQYVNSLDMFDSLVEDQLRNNNVVEMKQQSADGLESNISSTTEKSNKPIEIAHKSADLLHNEPINILPDFKQQYTKSSSARERPTICPICYEDVITHFTRHLFRHHANNKEVQLLQSLKPRSKQRLEMVASLRKQGYFHLKIEKNVLHPIRTSKNKNTEYFVCTYCLGHYSKKLLYKHIKNCKNKPKNEKNPGKNCQSKSQTFMALLNQKNNEFLKTSRLKNEVFEIMRADNISATAKNDPLICLYGESLLHKHKRRQIVTVVSNKIREMGRLLISLRSINPEVHTFFDAIKPDMFQSLISATKDISGYNIDLKSFRSPSLALHMGTNLKMICDIAYKIVLEKRNIPKIEYSNRDIKRNEIKDLKKLIEGHWCNEISSLALKNLKENNWEKPTMLPLTNDIKLFQEYLKKLADDAFENLIKKVDIKRNYKILTECVLTLVIMFNRKRVGDVQYLTIDAYTKEYNTTNHENFYESLTEVEKILCQKFKRVVSGGKGTKPVPVLFSKPVQRYIECLLNIRRENDLVPQSNPYLFANTGSENRWMAGVNVIGKLARRCGAKRPELLTSTKFRKHIATTLQLMSLDENEIEQLATFMGHTKKTHSEFYRLPQDIYQTSKVAKVLILLEKGEGNMYKGKKINEIQLENDVYYSSESEEEQHVSQNINRILETNTFDNVPMSSNNVTSSLDLNVCVQQKEKKSSTTGRVKWSNEEKKIVLQYFAKHIKKKITPKKHECEEVIRLHSDILASKGWVRIKTFVYNSFREK